MARRRSVAACLAAIIATIVSVLAAAGPGQFSLAVLRRDGVMIPFASYTGREWVVSWPGTDTALPLPISLADVPKRWWGSVGPDAPWKAWMADGSTRPLKLQKPVHVPIFCGARLAIATDYRGDGSAEEPGPTVPKDSLATAGDVTLLPITQVSVAAPDAARLITAMTERFNREETLATEHFTNWMHPYGPLARSRVPITLEAFYRSTETDGGQNYRISYIEAVRKYPAREEDQGCGLITFARGWVIELPERKPYVNIGARVTYCDRADVSFIQPFGRIRVARGSGKDANAETFWVYQTSSWRDEFYTITRVARDSVRPVLVVAGGACAKEPAK